MKLTDRIRRALLVKLLKQNEREAFFRAITPLGYEGRPAAWANDIKEQVKHYKHWAYSAVTAIAERVSATPFRIYARHTNGEVEELVDGHPAPQLFEGVNPFHTRTWLWNMTMIFLGLTGNCYWWKVKDRLGVVRELWVIHSQYMKIIPSKTEFIQAYEYKQGKEAIRFAPDEIVHLKYPNPRSMYYGYSPLQAAAEAVDTYEYMKQAQWSAFKQGIFPGLTLSTDQQLKKETIERIQTNIENRYGGTKQAGKVFVLEQGLNPLKITLTPQEMAFLESSNLSRTDILGIYKVPEAIAGISQNVNKAVAKAMDDIFAKYCVAPKLMLMQDQIDQDLMKEFDPKIFCEFDSPVAVDKELELKDHEMGLKNAVFTINEVRARKGLPAVPWGETPWLPLSLMPISSPREGEEGEKVQVYMPQDAVRKIKDEQWEIRRRRIGEAFVEKVAAQERKLVPDLRKYFKRQGRIIKRNLKRLLEMEAEEVDEAEGRGMKQLTSDQIAGLIDHEEENFLLGKTVNPHLHQALEAGIAREIANLGLNAESFSIDNPAARAWLGKKNRNYWENKVTKSTISQLTTELQAGMLEGEGIPALSDRVGKVMGHAERYRSVRIARTEVVGANNAGGYLCREANGIPKKEWITALDDLTREDHADADGQVRSNNAPYDVGGEKLMFPGDPDGSPEQIINCRCTDSGIPE